MSVYNDEVYNERATIIVTDQQGNRLPYDFALPWWSSFKIAPKQLEEFLEDDDGQVNWVSYTLGKQVSEALEALCTEKLGIEFRQDVGGGSEDEDPITTTYLIKTPPTISHTSVYVEE